MDHAKRLEEAPGKALADVAGRSEGLIALLDELKIAKAERSTTGVTVREEFDHTPDGRRSLGHRAVASVQLRFTDPEPIGRVIVRAGEELQARIDGPRWHVSASNPVRLEAASQAAAHARQKAEAYAAGVNAQLGELISLTEPDTERTGIVLQRMRAAQQGIVPTDQRNVVGQPLEPKSFPP